MSAADLEVKSCLFAPELNSWSFDSLHECEELDPKLPEFLARLITLDLAEASESATMALEDEDMSVAAQKPSLDLPTGPTDDCVLSWPSKLFEETLFRRSWSWWQSPASVDDSPCTDSPCCDEPEPEPQDEPDPEPVDDAQASSDARCLDQGMQSTEEH